MAEPLSVTIASYRDEDGYCSHSISAYRFERGVAAVLVCEGCGHTRLLAELPDTAPAQEGPGHE